MLPVERDASIQDAGQELLGFALRPENWVQLAGPAGTRAHPDGAYQRKVGKLRICASVDVDDKLEVFLRVAFRAPGLTPLAAVDHLEAFVGDKMPLKPNVDWQVIVDANEWVHFVRRFTAEPLRA